MTEKEDRRSGKISRRKWLAGAAAAASIAFVRTAAGQGVHAAVGVAGDTTRLPGPLPGKLGRRSAFEHPAKAASDISSRTPLQDLYGMITPSDLHFERHHSGVPTIDPAKYELMIHGMVDRPMVFTLADLKRFP
ncbi:MAG TPA: molybdopterin-dependent oxidoreductase, partial [Puia sp.]